MKKPFLFFLLLLTLPLVSQNIYNHIPISADTTLKYIFYLHGRIIEDEGIRPVSKKYGIYEYDSILQTLAEPGFMVISEPRPKNTDALEYAKKTALQIDSLLKSGVPIDNITIIGASKGAAIAVQISNLLKMENLKFVIMAICNNETAAFWKMNEIKLYGKILYIYDYKDEIAGSCENYQDILKSEGLKEYREIKVLTGLGHGILYTPMKEWVIPAIEWSKR